MAQSVPAKSNGIQTVPPYTVKKDYTKEYVLVNGYSLTQQRILGTTHDDVELEINLETYERMENDATIAKSKHILITNVLSDDLQMAPGATEDEVSQSEYDVYVNIMQFCKRTVDGLDKPYRESLEGLLGNGVRYGHGIGEVEWEYRMDAQSTDPAPTVPKKSKLSSLWEGLGFTSKTTDKTTPKGTGIRRPILRSQKVRLMPKSIKVKPRNSVQFVVDDYMNVLGLVPRRRRYDGPNAITWNEIIDRTKFLVLTLKKEDEDPRGKSSYRAAFNWYNIKSQVPQEMLRFILEESVPKAVGTLPPDMAPFEFVRDDNGEIVYNDPDTKKDPQMLTAAESFSRNIQGFRSGSGAVIPNGATLVPFKTTGASDADFFHKVLKVMDDQIENSILLQTLAQSEGEHQARSAAQQVAELLYNLTFWVRWQLAMMTLNDLLKQAVIMNFGEWAVRYLPIISLGDFVRRNWVEELKAYADAYFKGLLDDTQRPEIMSNMNLPKPGPSRAELMAQADINGNPAMPNSNRPDKGVGAGRNKGNGTVKKNDTTANTRFGPVNMLGNNRGWFSRVTRNIFSGR